MLSFTMNTTHSPRYVDGILILTIDQTGCPSDLSYEHATEWLQQYAIRHNCDFYARPRESFDLYEAARLARERGNNTVIVEDLS